MKTSSRFRSIALVWSAITLLFAAAFLAQPVFAVDATWNGSVDGQWSNGSNWSATPVPGTGNQALFNNAGGGNTTIDLGGGVTIRQLVFNASGAAAYTIGSGAVNSQSLTLDSTGNGTIQMNSTVQNHQLVNAQVNLPGTANYLFTNASTSNNLTVAGNIVAGASVAGNLLKTGGGLVILSGTNDWAANTFTANFYITGGGELRLTGGQNNFNRSTAVGRPRSFIGTDSAGGFSGGNTMTLSGGGRMVTAGITIGGGTYTPLNTFGNNKLVISTPGTSGSKTWTNIGAQGSDIYDFGASVVGQNTDGNSIEISNGAYVDVPTGGKSFYIGANRSINLTDIPADANGDFLNQGANNNYVSITGANSTFNRTSNNATYVGFNGNGNYVEITNGGRFNANRLNVGANGDNNYVRVNGAGSILNGGAQDILAVGGGNGFGAVVAGATPSGNYILIENGGTMNFVANGNRDNNIGNVNGANNNYIEATGVGSSFQIRESQPLFIGSSNGGGDTTATGNYLAVSDGATGIVHSINAGGIDSKVKVGSGTANIAQLEIRATSGLGGIFLKNASGRLEMDNGRLVAGQNGAITPGTMVSGLGEINLLGPAYFSTIYSGSTISTPITGVGDFHKEGIGTLQLTQSNSSTGDTYVDAGVLRVDQALLDDGASVYLFSAGNGRMNLSFTGSDTISKLFFDGVQQSAGTWGNSTSSATYQDDTFFDDFILGPFGAGVLNVLEGPGGAEVVPEPSTLVLAAMGLLGLGLLAWRQRNRVLPHKL